MGKVVALNSARISKLLPPILLQKKAIVDNICRNTTRYDSEWLRACLNKNFENIVILILSGDRSYIVGKEEVAAELALRKELQK